MRLRLLFLLIAITVLFSLSASRGSSDSGSHASPKTSRLYSAGSIDAGSYRSPGKLHKVLIANNDYQALARAKGAIQIADYGSFRLLVMNEAAIQDAEEQGTSHMGRVSGTRGCLLFVAFRIYTLLRYICDHFRLRVG